MAGVGVEALGIVGKWLEREQKAARRGGGGEEGGEAASALLSLSRRGYSQEQYTAPRGLDPATVHAVAGAGPVGYADRDAPGFAVVDSFLERTHAPVAVGDAEVLAREVRLLHERGAMRQAGLGGALAKDQPPPSPHSQQQPQQPEARKDRTQRGDSLVWITESTCQQYGLRAVHAFVGHMTELCRELRTGYACVQQMGLTGSFSVQAACYPGDGTGYVRHVDAFRNRQGENRQLTFVLYLNGAGWDAERDGGVLRVHFPHGPCGPHQLRRAEQVEQRERMEQVEQGTPVASTPDPAHTPMRSCFRNQPFHDVIPACGRAVVFRSQDVPHEVLPARRKRFAITFWAYGTGTMPLPATISSPSSVASSSGAAAAAAVAAAAATATATTTQPALSPPQHPPHQQSQSQQLPRRQWPWDDTERWKATDQSWKHPLPVRVGAAGDNDGDCEAAVPRIFVSIASFRDSECQHTVVDLFEKAAQPERVRVGIVWQSDHMRAVPPVAGSCEDDHCFLRPVPEQWAEQVKELHMHHREARGPCWARHLAQALMEDEEFFLQIDSHMRFRPSWDTYLIQELEALEQQRTPDGWPCAAVLTTYPPGYKLPNKVPGAIEPTILVPSHFDATDGLLRQKAERLAAVASAPVPITLWAAGFSFSRAQLVEDVPYDPQLQDLFFGEEVLMAAQMFMAGYDCFAPAEAVAYHVWSRAHRPVHQPKAASAVRQRAMAKLRRILQLDGGDSDASDTTVRHSSNQAQRRKRSLAEFEEAARIDMRNRVLLDGAKTAGLDPARLQSTRMRSALAAIMQHQTGPDHDETKAER